MDDILIKGTENTIGHFVTSLLQSIGSTARGELDKIRFDLSEGFSEYVHHTYERCSKVKTLIHRNQRIDIEKCYVEPSFRINNTSYSEKEFITEIGRDGKFIVTGSAGSGKSVFMKNSYLRIIERSNIGFPVFVELRHLKDATSQKDLLLDFIYERVSTLSPAFTKTQLKYGLRKGAIVLILDGYDELPISLKDIIEKEVCFIAENYPKSPIIVSSRPDDRFVSWEVFSRAQLEPMSKEQVLDLVRKIDFDHSKKKQFTKAINNGLYEKRASFLSNPLLATMMLLTFDQFGEIPEKQHVFYDKSFQVLTREHDSMKSQFTRELYCGAGVDELEEIFMNFCALTYIDQKYEFTEKETCEYIADAADISSISSSVDSAAVMKDFLESISIMQRDGDQISFIHRSFQEYFFSKYAISTRDIELKDLLIPVLGYGQSESVIEMIHDMNPSYLECNFLLPAIRKIYKSIKDVDPLSDPADVLMPYFRSASVVARPALLDENSKKPTLRYSRSFRIKDRSDKAFPILMIACQLRIIKEEFFLQEEQEVLARLEKNRRYKQIAIRRDNNDVLIAAGVEKMAERFKDKTGEAMTVLEQNCARRQESKSKQIIGRIKKRR